MKLSFEDKDSFKETTESLRFNDPPSDPNTLLRVGSSSSMISEERSEDIYFDNHPSNPPNTLRRMGSSSSVWSEEE